MTTRQNVDGANEHHTARTMGKRNAQGRAFAWIGFTLLLWVTMMPLTGVVADPCDDIEIWSTTTGSSTADDVESNADSTRECVEEAWDPTSSVGCTPFLMGDEQVGDPECGGGHTLDGSGAKCGYGWAQSWAVSVEVTEGATDPNLEVEGWITCGNRDPDATGVGAECTVRVNEVSCSAGGGSKRDPIDCGGEILGGVNVKAVVKCEDPANPDIVIEKALKIAVEDAPLP